MISLDAAERVERWIGEAKAGGAEITLGGKRTGQFLEPTVLLHTSPEMKVNCEEVFAPLVTVTPYRTLDDAIASAKVMAGMKKDAEVELLVLPKAKNFIDVLMESRSDTRLGEPRYISTRVLTQLGSPLPEIGKHVRSLSGFLQLRADPVWTILPCRVEVK